MIEMTVRLILAFSFLIAWATPGFSAHLFHGQLTLSPELDSTLYLSLVDDYRDILTIKPEDIIARTRPAADGTFRFSGDFLPPGEHIYRLHFSFDSLDPSGYVYDLAGGHNFILFTASPNDTLQFFSEGDQRLFAGVEGSSTAGSWLALDSLRRHIFATVPELTAVTNRELLLRQYFNRMKSFSTEQALSPANRLITMELLALSQTYRRFRKDDFRIDPSFYRKLEDDLTTSASSYLSRYQEELAGLDETGKPTAPSLLWLVILLGATTLFFAGLSGWLWRRNRELGRSAEEQADPFAELTPQELRITELIAAGQTNSQIAETLFISLSTVKKHINHIYGKMGVADREKLKELYRKRKA